jgi:hypothetical protein
MLDNDPKMHANGRLETRKRTLLPPGMASAVKALDEESAGALSDDLLIGAISIATWMGLADEKQLYNMHLRTDIPIFTLPGLGLVARKQALMDWIVRHERAALERKQKQAEKNRGGRRAY